MDMVLSSYSIDIVKGKASFKSSNCLVVGNEETEAEKIIIATGTSPCEIKGLEFDGEKIISSTDVLNLKEIPKKILIVGGGAIGIEFAAIIAGFGSSVTLAEREAQHLPQEDFEIAEEIKKNLRLQGVDVLTSCNDAFDLEDDFDKTLVVTGRKPLSDLELEKAGVILTEKGFIKTDDYCMTNIENIYAAGDAAGRSFLAYTAQNEGVIAAENAVFGNKIEVDNSAVPSVVFSNPPAASVKVKGFSDKESFAQSTAFGKFPFTASGRAFIENERTGFVKCAVDKNTAKPLAFWIVGAHADEIINTAAAILKSGRISRESMFHPSFTEGLLNAYEDAFGKCTEKAGVKSSK
jgi:dihydrolipoamide dehydrogenase